MAIIRLSGRVRLIVGILLLLNTVKIPHNATMKPMTYKGYAAHIKYSDDEACFIGHITGITDVIGFHADNVQDLRDAFGAAVDDYLTTCEKLNRPDQKPASGKLMLLVPPEVHGEALVAAQVKGMSLNQWASQALREAAHI